MNSSESVVSVNTQQVPARPVIRALCFAKGTDPKDSRKEAWISNEGSKTCRVYVADPKGPMPSVDGEVWLCEEVSHGKVRNGISDTNRIVVSLKHKIMDDTIILRFEPNTKQQIEGKFPWGIVRDLATDPNGRKVIFNPDKQQTGLISSDRAWWKCKFKHAPQMDHSTNFFVIIVKLVEEDAQGNALTAQAKKQECEAKHMMKRVKKLRDEYDIERQGQWLKLQTTKRPGRGVIR